MTVLRVGDVEVATYVADPQLDIRLAPRPYLHPVRTLGGTVVTEILPHDHPWHLGASLTVADVAGSNLWGGRTYVRDEGYVWRDDHGRIRHDAWLPAGSGSASGSASGSGFAERLSWCAGDGRTLLREERAVTATPAAHGWELSFRYALTAPRPTVVALGSPATNGRSGGAGYGGFFWRAPDGKAAAFTEGSEEPNGSADPWVALTVNDDYTLVFRGLSGDDRWFVRTDEYAGVCAALAFEHELTIPPGETISRHIRVLIADGVLTRSQISAGFLPAA
jgi:hypothetical protein